jgi:hypothetical protein
MATSNSNGVVASGTISSLGVSTTDASRISVAKTKQSYNGTAIADSAVRSLTKNLRIAYAGVEGNISDV